MTLRQGVASYDPELHEQMLKEVPHALLRDVNTSLKNKRALEYTSIKRDNRHLMISLFSVEDVGNSDYFLAKGLRQLGHRACAFRQRDNEHQYPSDVQIVDDEKPEAARMHNLDAVQQYFHQSDIIQIEDSWGIPPIPGQTKLEVNLANSLNNFRFDKMLILYHKGTTYRFNSSKIHNAVKEMFKCKILHFVSTPDLLQLHDDNIWMPNIIDMDYILKRWPKKEEKYDDLIRIVYPFTDPNNFGVQTVFKTINELKDEKYPIQFSALRNRPWAEVMELMSEADIHIGKVIDNLPNPYNNERVFLPYGVGTIEAGVYKIPTLTSIPLEHERADREHKCTSKLPILNVRPSDFGQNLKYLLDNPSIGRELGEKMYKHTLKYHNIKSVCEKYDNIIRTEFA